MGQRREVQGLIPKGFGSSNLPLRIRDSQIKEEHERARPDEGAAKERGGDSDES